MTDQLAEIEAAWREDFPNAGLTFEHITWLRDSLRAERERVAGLRSLIEGFSSIVFGATGDISREWCINYFRAALVDAGRGDTDA